DLQILFEIAMKNHLLASRTLPPEILRDFTLPKQRAEARPDVFGKPAQRELPPDCGKRLTRLPERRARLRRGRAPDPERGPLPPAWRAQTRPGSLPMSRSARRQRPQRPPRPPLRQPARE